MRKKLTKDVVGKSHQGQSVLDETPSINGKYLYISRLRLALMNIFTLNLYSCYWFYMNWKYVKDRDGLDISPFWRCIFSPFYCHSLFKQIRNDGEMNSVKKATFNASAWATGWVVLMVTTNLLSRLNKMAGPWPHAAIVRLCIYIPIFLFLLPIQGYINLVNESLNPKTEFLPMVSGPYTFFNFWTHITHRHF